MIVCDYCGKEIRRVQAILQIVVGDTRRDFHSDPDRVGGDCAGQVSLTLESLKGDRPAKSPA